ncbi:MAG: GAF domain-containing protein, partial [Nitrosomonadales bacterium]|nr:GAF domain-containing protein [Nitrosomonadales bacterium]
DQLNVTVNLANELTSLVAKTNEEDRAIAIQQLLKRYESAVKLDAKDLNMALEKGLEEINLRASILSINTGHSDLLKQVGHWTGKDISPEQGAIATQQEEAAQQEVPETIDAHESEEILQAGIQDVTNTLVSDHELNDILHMVVETMYRGMQFNCVLMLFRDNKSNAMRAGFGLGKGIEQMLPKFGFPMKFEPDVFHLAIEKGVDIVIEDIAADKIVSKIPDWYHKVSDAKSFLLLPVMVNNKAVACLYADMLTTNQLEVSAKHLSLLRTLRNQAVLAIKQKH